MTAEVTNMHQTPGARDELVQYLEQLTEEARRGELTGFAAALLFTGNATGGAFFGVSLDPIAVLGQMRVTMCAIEQTLASQQGLTPDD